MAGQSSSEAKEYAGFLGDGESTEGTVTVAQFLELYPLGVFRPLLEAEEVKITKYPGGDSVKPYASE